MAQRLDSETDTMAQPPRLMTVGEIARMLGVATHRVEYVVNTRGMRGAAVVARYRAFSLDDLEFIRAEIARIDSLKGGAV